MWEYHQVSSANKKKGENVKRKDGVIEAMETGNENEGKMKTEGRG